MEKGKQIVLKSLDWKVYEYLKNKFKLDPNHWVSKEEFLMDIEELRDRGGSTSHDSCSILNSIRIKLNRASSQGLLSHIILLDNDCFKIAQSKEEAEQYLKRDLNNGLKLIVRYYQNLKVIKEDGQGRLLDRKGNVISEDSLAKKFNDVFNV